MAANTGGPLERMIRRNHNTIVSVSRGTTALTAVTSGLGAWAIVTDRIPAMEELTEFWFGKPLATQCVLMMCIFTMVARAHWVFRPRSKVAYFHCMMSYSFVLFTMYQQLTGIVEGGVSTCYVKALYPLHLTLMLCCYIVIPFDEDTCRCGAFRQQQQHRQQQQQ